MKLFPSVKKKLRQLIADEFETVSQEPYFLTSFTIKIVSGDVYTNIQCQSKIDNGYNEEKLYLKKCASKKVVLDRKSFGINFKEIAIDDSSKSFTIIR